MSEPRTSNPGRRIGLALAVAALLAITLVALPASPQQVGVGLALDVQTPVTVGDTNKPGSLGIVNVSDPGANAVTVTEISLTPACGDILPFTGCSLPEPGTIAVNSPAIGRAGSACAGVVFNVVGPEASGRYLVVPGSPVVLPIGARCDIDFTYNVLRSPVQDASLVAPGQQTRFFATVTGRTTTANGGVLSPSAQTNQVTTVSSAPPTSAPPRPPASGQSPQPPAAASQPPATASQQPSPPRGGVLNRTG